MRKHTYDDADLKVVVTSEYLSFTNNGVALGKLEVNAKREVYSGQIGTEDGQFKHSPVDYDMVSWFYGKSRGIKENEKVTIEVHESNSPVPLFSLDFYSSKPLFSAEVSPDKSGSIKFKIDWGKIPSGQQTQSKYVYVKVLDNNTNNKKLLYNGGSFISWNTVPLKKSSEVLKLAGYSSAAIVGSTSITGNGKDNKNGVCEAEAKVRAFMRMLRVKEETVGDVGYERIVGGKSFIKDYGKDWSTHPKISVWIKRIESSSNAAGAYQFMGNTYDEIKKNYRKKYNIIDFGKESQDKMCLVLMKHYYVSDRPDVFYNTSSAVKNEWRKRFKGQQGDIIQFIIDDNFKRASLLASLCWSSLPDSPYGQQSSSYTYVDVKNIYDQYLKEELEGKSDLHLKKGFLKEFGYSCCNDTATKDSRTKWREPVDSPQITIYTAGALKRPWRSAFGMVRPDLGRPHHGLDLFAKLETNIYACLPGKVIYANSVDGYGKVLIIKIENVSDFKNSKLDYSPYYIKSKREYSSSKYDINNFPDFTEYEGIESSNDIYLKYAHLSQFLVKVGDIISEIDYKTKIIGKTGDTGANGTKGPHLHFEISSVAWPDKTNQRGFGERYNPAKYVNYKNESQLTNNERIIQDNNSK